MPDSDVTGISCPSVDLCVAVTTKQTDGATPSGGEVLTSTNPTGPASAWKIATVEQQPDGLGSVACPSVSLCVVGDDSGNIVTSTDPTGGASTWDLAPVQNEPTFAGHAIAAISCPSIALCVAVDPSGDVLTSTDPTGGPSAWTVAAHAGGAQELRGVSCSSEVMCVAVGSETAVTSTNPTGGANAWSAATIDAPSGSSQLFALGMTSVACPSQGLCVAVDATGRAIASSAPLNGADTWVANQVGGINALSSLACPSTLLCVAVDNSGHVVSTTDPTAGAGAWTASEIDPANELLGVSCPSSSLCVAGDNAGNILASTEPTNPATWALANVDGHYAINGISCPSTSLCVAVDNDGNAITSTNPAGGASAWTVAAVLQPGAQEAGGGRGYFDAVSCSSLSLCVASAGGQLVTSTNPTGGPPAWHTTSASVSSVSCPLAAQCFGSSYAGLATTRNAEGPTAAWTPAHAELGFPCAENVPADPCGLSSPFTGGEAAGQTVSCASVNFCAGINPQGYASTSTAESHIGDWTATNTDDPAGPFPIACPSTSLCVAVDTNGDALIGSPALPGATGYIGTASIGRPTSRAGVARIPVHCTGATQATCRIALRLTTTERLSPRDGLIDIATHSSTATKVVQLSAVTITIAAGKAKTATLNLNRSAEHLLLARHKLPTSLTATQTWLGGYSIALPTQTTTLTNPRRAIPPRARRPAGRREARH